MDLAGHSLSEFLKKLKRCSQYSEEEVTIVSHDTLLKTFTDSWSSSIPIANEAAACVLRGSLIREYTIKSHKGKEENGPKNPEPKRPEPHGFYEKDNYSLDHLTLYACLFCQASDKERATVFLDVVQPELRGMITLHEPALRKAVKFICLCSFFWWQYAKDIDVELQEYYSNKGVRLMSQVYCLPNDET